jgi:hypothetical protein
MKLLSRGINPFLSNSLIFSCNDNLFSLRIFFLFIKNNMKTIVFWDNCLSERGTTVSLFNYAFYNEKLLGNKSVVMYNSTRHENDINVIQNFKKHFMTIGVSNFKFVDAILSHIKADIFYIIKAGSWDNQISKVCKTVVHCVFHCNQPHGNVYAGISNWINGNPNKVVPVVPHMIDLPSDTNENFRNKLGIPEDSVVFGRHGGYDQFDIQFVRDIVFKVASENPNIYFLFLNTAKFCNDLPNIIHLEKIIDIDDKVKFINSCDAMLWARQGGESFGLAIGEFSIKNKPVFVTDSKEEFGINKGDIAHVYLLKDKGIWYNRGNLEYLLKSFDRNEASKYNWNAYEDYTPEKVMNIFKKIFIDEK